MRCISAGVYAGMRLSSRMKDDGYSRRHTPGATRPARPARCEAEARAQRRSSSVSVLARAS